MTWKVYSHPSDREGTSVENGSENGEMVESVAAPGVPAGHLEADLKAARDEVAEWQDRFLRKAAEFENFRKRSEKEKTDSIALAKSSVLFELLPIADAGERALKSLAESKAAGNLQQFQQGFELIYRQLLDTLSRLGIQPIEAEGKPFDPHLHEALSREETAEVKEDTIIRELRRGYLFKEKLLRPAQVIVAVHPQGKDQTS